MAVTIVLPHILSFVCYRQAVGATIAVANNVTGEIWMFMKEISSDGDVSTVCKLSEQHLLQVYNTHKISMR